MSSLDDARALVTALRSPRDEKAAARLLVATQNPRSLAYWCAGMLAALLDHEADLSDPRVWPTVCTALERARGAAPGIEADLERTLR